MKKLSFVVFLCALNYANPSTAWASDKSYSMAQVCRTNPKLMLTKVTLTKDETILDLEYTETESNRNIGIYPPGHDMAFFITDVSNSKKYNLLDSEGVAIRPNKNDLRSGDVVKFRLVFELIPMKRFHLIEGKLPTETMVTWHFTNIKLQ